MRAGVQIITPTADPGAPPSGDPPTASVASANPPATTGTSGAPSSGQPGATDQDPTASPAGSTPTTPATTDQPGLKATPKATDPKDESTSKKKKGLRKLVPW